MSRPMTLQGKIKNCAENVLLSLKQDQNHLAHYWVTALRTHLDGNKNAVPGKKITLRPEVQRLVDRALSRWPELEHAAPAPEIRQFVERALSGFPKEPKAYTLYEDQVAKIADAAAKIVYGMNEESVGDIAEAVRKSVFENIGTEASKCN